MFPYNFTIALPIQMLIVAPLSGVIVHAVGDKAGWNREARQRTPKLGVETVADVMQKDVYTVSDTATVRDAVRVMLDRNISGVPIVNETGAVVGFVSDSDVLRRFAQDNLPVSDISMLITGMARGEFPELSHAPHEPAEVFMGLHDDWDNIDDRLRTRTRGQDGMKHQVERIAA